MDAGMLRMVAQEVHRSRFRVVSGRTDLTLGLVGGLIAISPQRSQERTHFCSSELTQQVRIDLWSAGQTSRSRTCLQATIPLFDRRNHSSVPTWVPQDMASAGGQ